MTIRKDQATRFVHDEAGSVRRAGWFGVERPRLRDPGSTTARIFIQLESPNN